MGSSHPGEENIVLAAHKRLRRQYPDLLLILVPRHPYRSNEVLELARNKGFKSSLLSQHDWEEGDEVIIGDTMGTLVYLYGLAQVAFLGGSLNDTGGHNPIEAAIHGIPMIMGPSRDNFDEVVKRFEEKGCLLLGNNSTEIAELVGGLLANEEDRKRRGQLALEVVANNRGAKNRLVRLLKEELTVILKEK